MKKFYTLLVTLLTLGLGQSLTAQTIADVEQLLDFAETDPSFFAPPQQTKFNVAGWHYRFYPGTGTYAAVNISDGSIPPVGGVFVVGGVFGGDVLFVGLLSDLITQINNSPKPTELGGMINEGSGNCVDLQPPAQGTDVDLVSTFSQDISFNVNQVYVAVSDNQITLSSVQNSDFMGITSNTDATNTQFFDIVGDGRFLTGLEASTSSEITGVGNQTTSTVHNYSPALFNGPATTFCEGMVWSDGVVSQEIVFTSSNPVGPDTITTTTSNSIETISTVQSVNAAISTPAGNFTTVQILLESEGSRVTSWTDVDTGLVVKADTQDDDGTTSVLELVRIN